MDAVTLQRAQATHCTVRSKFTPKSAKIRHRLFLNKLAVLLSGKLNKSCAYKTTTPSMCLECSSASAIELINNSVPIMSHYFIVPCRSQPVHLTVHSAAHISVHQFLKQDTGQGNVSSPMTIVIIAMGDLC